MLLISYLSGVKPHWEEEGQINRYRKEIGRYVFDFFNPLMKNNKDEFLPKDRIMFLNFNYTSSIENFFDWCHLPYDYNVNHIHGNLNDKDSVIFGYGFENNDDYLKLEKLTIKNLLTYCKRPRYSDYENESKLRSFMRTNSFEVYIVGHSCGTSDKTFLHNIFENQHCKSIRVFYYQREDGTNDRNEKCIEIHKQYKNNDELTQLIKPRNVKNDIMDKINLM